MFGFHKLRRRNTEEIVAEDRLTARFRPTRKMRAAELKRSVAMGGEGLIGSEDRRQDSVRIQTAQVSDHLRGG